MLVLIDQDRAGTADESPGIGANGGAGGGIVAVDDGAAQPGGEGVQKGALADGAGAVENDGRFLGQATSQHGRELARSYAGERSVHDLQATAFRICR
jgi:hypothetical protein